jgi:cell wall integrity and stress response component
VKATSASSDTSSTWTPTPIISLETITGQVRTVTVTPTAPPNSQSNSTVSKSKSGGLSTGGAVGLTVGLVALVAIIAGIAFFCIRKRRQEKAEAYNAVNSRRESMAGLGGPIPSRTMSENSRYVLGTDGRRVVETWEPEIRTPGSRNSQMVPVDPRLDPFAPVYQRGENKSRESFNTIRDDHDYSRRVHQQGPILRAMNPDPD